LFIPRLRSFHVCYGFPQLSLLRCPAARSLPAFPSMFVNLGASTASPVDIFPPLQITYLPSPRRRLGLPPPSYRPTGFPCFPASCGPVFLIFFPFLPQFGLQSLPSDVIVTFFIAEHTLFLLFLLARTLVPPSGPTVSFSTLRLGLPS